MTRPIGAGPAGSGITAPVTAADVSMTPIAPDTSTDVQSGLDWRASHVGSDVVIDNWADVVRMFGPAVAGVWTINQKVYQTGPVVVPSANSLLMTDAGSWTGSSIEVPLIGDVDGALLSGDLILHRFLIGNSNLGANAKDIDAFATGTRVIVIDDVVFTGTRAGDISDTVGLRVTGCLYLGPACLAGHTLYGANLAVRYADNSATLVGPNFGALTVSASATFSGLGLTGCTFDLPLLTQYGVAIASAIVIPATVVVQLIAMINSEPVGGPMLRQDPGDMLDDDLRIVIEACPSLPPWSAVGIAFREDSANPLPVNLSGVNPQVVPFRESATLPETELLNPRRATLVKNPADNYDTYVQYSGPERDVSQTVFYSMSVRRASGGTNLLRCTLLRNDFPAYAGWVEVTGTAMIITNGTTLNEAGSRTLAVMNPGDRIQLQIEDLDGASDAEVAVVQYGFE